MKKAMIAGILAAVLALPLASGAKNAGYAADKIDIYLRGKPLALNADARLEEGVTLVPLRDLAEALGAEVQWDAASRSATVIKADASVKIAVGASTADKNGYRFDMQGKAQLVNDVLMVPVRAISETFHMVVKWDGENRAVHIDQPEELPAVGSLDHLRKLLSDAQAARSLSMDYTVGLATDSAAVAVPSPASGSAAAAKERSPAPQEAAKSEAGATVKTPAADGDYSRTNTQVEGVDEADVVKTDGTYIYQVNRQRIIVAQATPADQMRIVGSVDFREQSFVPREIYVDDRYLTVIGSSSRSVMVPAPRQPIGIMEEKMIMRPDTAGETTIAKVFDQGDRTNLKQVREIELEGYYVSSRKIGSSLYLVTNKHLNAYNILNNSQTPEDALRPGFRDSAVSADMKRIEFPDIRYFPGSPESNYLLLAGIDLNRMDRQANVSAYLGSGSQIYASEKHLYIAVTRYDAVRFRDTAGQTDAAKAPVAPGERERKTVIYKFRMDQGATHYLGQGEVPGSVLNQFSMDEHNGYFRIATTTGDVWRTDERTSKNNLYILDEGLKTIGRLENLAPGENIYSVRYMGDRAYVVTFKTVDPLFVIDLLNPREPRVLGALKIPGYSDYLHPYDENHIIGFGKDTIEMQTPDGKGGNSTMAYYQGMKIAVFDVTDVTRPVELHKVTIGDRGTDSELLRNHKALLFSKEKNLLAFPVTLREIRNPPNQPYGIPAYGEFTFQGAYVYSLDLQNGFTLKGRITHLSEEDLRKAGQGWHDSNFNVNRILYIGDTLYTLSFGKIKANDIATLAEKGSLIIP